MLRTRYRFWLSSFVLPGLLLTVGCTDAPVAGTADSNATDPLETVAESGGGTFAAATDTDAIDELVRDSVAEATVPNDPPGQAAPLDAPPRKLGIGDQNPGLQIAKWVKGDPVDDTLTDKVHVVEFWATWCPPCRAGMPHISELQHKFADDVAFIGVTREDEATVEKFLASNSPDGKTWDEVVQYRLALDDRDWTNTAYMRAAGQNGIPCAFIVGRDGVVEWIGHPGSIDEPLQQVVDGSWDREAAVAALKQQEKLRAMSSKLSRMMRTSDWDGALGLLGELEEETGKSPNLLKMRLTILQAAGRADEAASVRNDLVEASWGDASALNEIAWTAATSGKADGLELALKAAERASELRNHKDPAVLDTVARCCYEMGNLDEAIRWQKRASDNNKGYAEIDATLKRYRAEKAAEETNTEESDSEE